MKKTISLIAISFAILIALVFVPAYDKHKQKSVFKPTPDQVASWNVCYLDHIKATPDIGTGMLRSIHDECNLRAGFPQNY